MPKRVNAAWLQPVSTNPELLVDRDRELADLVGRLEEIREANLREVHILVTGPRGAGKSIFTREALRRFQRSHPDQIVAVSVDSRGLRYRPFLNRFAAQLVDGIRPHAERGKRKEILLWLDQLSLLANNSQVTIAQTETIARKYGADATIGADLMVRLQSKLSWEETRGLGTTIQATLAVSDDLLHAAITATLERLAEPDSRWLVVVFFDNLDQAALGDREDDVGTLFRHVFDLRPCVSIVHFRTEALIENVERDAAEKLDLKPLTAEVLFDVIRRRLEAATESVKIQFPADTDWRAVHRLARATDNPLVFLRWVHGFLRTQDWPPAANWMEPAHLAEIVGVAEPIVGVELDLVRRAVEIVDRCYGGRPDAPIRREDLLRGCPATDPNPPGQAISEQEIEDLIKLRVMLPRHRFQPSLGYRILPVLDLLRPSIRKSL